MSEPINILRANNTRDTTGLKTSIESKTKDELNDLAKAVEVANADSDATNNVVIEEAERLVIEARAKEVIQEHIAAEKSNNASLDDLEERVKFFQAREALGNLLAGTETEEKTRAGAALDTTAETVDSFVQNQLRKLPMVGDLIADSIGKISGQMIMRMFHDFLGTLDGGASAKDPSTLTFFEKLQLKVMGGIASNNRKKVCEIDIASAVRTLDNQYGKNVEFVGTISDEEWALPGAREIEKNMANSKGGQMQELVEKFMKANVTTDGVIKLTFKDLLNIDEIERKKKQEQEQQLGAIVKNIFEDRMKEVVFSDTETSFQSGKLTMSKADLEANALKAGSNAEKMKKALDGLPSADAISFAPSAATVLQLSSKKVEIGSNFDTLGLADLNTIVSAGATQKVTMVNIETNNAVGGNIVYELNNNIGILKLRADNDLIEKLATTTIASLPEIDNASNNKRWKLEANMIVGV